MPQYEYICEEDGDVIVLLRPMKDADTPVVDPAGRNRSFTRKHSVFGVAGGSTPGAGASAHVHTGACCPCGKQQSQCGRN